MVDWFRYLGIEVALKATQSEHVRKRVPKKLISNGYASTLKNCG